MRKFVCKHCGMITENPEIVPHPDRDKEFREILRIAREYEAKGKPVPGVYRVKEYNYSITCPVCLNETRFWRDEPFPTDTLTIEEQQAKLDYFLRTTHCRAD